MSEVTTAGRDGQQAAPPKTANEQWQRTIAERAAAAAEEQEEWARDRLRKAHAHFIEHLSSRTGYGDIMLMLDASDDALAEQYMPTGGETAAAKDNNKKNWAWLKSHDIVGEMSREIESSLATEIVQTISAERKDYLKYFKVSIDLDQIESDQCLQRR